MPVDNVIGFERCVCYHPDLVNLFGCTIGEGTKIGSFVEIGDGVKIGSGCKIQSFVYIPHGVEIGDDVFIGPQVCFMNVMKPDLSKKPVFLKTIVGDEAVIGAGVKILPGVVIGKKSFIAAGAIVSGDVEQNGFWGRDR